MGFKWATEFCSSAHVIIKTDDDVYVNIMLLRGTSDQYAGVPHR